MNKFMMFTVIIFQTLIYNLMQCLAVEKKENYPVHLVVFR